MVRIFLLICLLLIQPAFANVFEHETSLDKIAKELPEMNSIKCKFRQEKQISNMVLKSSGDFTFDKGKGVVFYTTYPVKSTTSYTSREYKQISSVINAISNKSYSRLQKDFKFYYEGAGVNGVNKSGSCNWTLGLIPKQDTPAYNHLKFIEITGQKDIKKIIILTCDKTKTTIWFE